MQRLGAYSFPVFHAISPSHQRAHLDDCLACLCANGKLFVNTTGAAGGYNFWGIIGRIIDYLAGAIGAVAITMFVVGAFLVTLSGIKEDWRQKGKDLMIGSAMSLAVVLGSYAILRMLEYFLTT